MKKRKKTMAKTLTVTFIFILIIVAIMSYCTFSYITRYIERERQEIESGDFDSRNNREKVRRNFWGCWNKNDFLIRFINHGWYYDACSNRK